MRRLGICGLILALGGCGGSDTEVPTQYEFGGDRPVFLEVPAAYDHDAGAPLLVVLHGFGANAYTQLAYTGLDELVNEAGALLLAPEGTVNGDGKQFWNANTQCCDFENTGVDDVGYITGLIDDVSATWNVNQVYLFGHSNGGYMSYRMACDRADRIDGIVSLAGLAWADESACQPSEQVAVLQIHGTVDDMVPYDGGSSQPGAMDSAAIWAGHNGCTGGARAAAGRLDLDSTLAGDETAVEVFDGCPAEAGVELWTIEGGAHIPTVTEGFRGEVWRFLTGA